MGYDDIIKEYVALNKKLELLPKEKLTLLQMLKIDFYNLNNIHVSKEEEEIYFNLDNLIISKTGIENLEVKRRFIVDNIIDNIVNLTCYWILDDKEITIRLTIEVNSNIKIKGFSALDIQTSNDTQSIRGWHNSILLLKDFI